MSQRQSAHPTVSTGNPHHVAIIMDGNGRWATSRGLPRSEGHRHGVEAVRRVVRAATELGIPNLTLYGFSSENWSRPPAEVAFLMGLIRRFIRRDLAALHEQNVRVQTIGTMEGVSADIVRLIDEARTLTQHNTALMLTIAFNYGARDELARAAARLAAEVASGRLSPASITPSAVDARLDTAGLPDPDLLIRTGGDQRLSNFLLWQCAYAELIFVETQWPDFGRETFNSAIASYRARERRFGGLGVTAMA